MSKNIGFGVIGAGLISPFHLKAIRDSNGGRMVAVCDVDKDRADKMAAEFGIKAYYDVDSLINDNAIHVVCVATPNHLHRDAVIKCAKAGKHVLTEKPPAMTLAETDEMIAVCDKAGVKFGCFVQCRTRKAIQAMKTAINDGRFGKLLHADAYMKWFRPDTYYSSSAWRSSRKSGSGVTVAQAFHYIDLLYYLAGPAAEVEAKMMNLAHPGVPLEDTTLAVITYANGAKGILQASTALWPGTDVRIEINGTKGTAIMTGEKMVTWQFQDERPEDEAIRQIGSGSAATGARGAADLGWSDHQVVVQNMIDIIGTDKLPVIPVDDVRPSLEIVLAMYQSAAYKKSVALPIKDDENVWAMK